MVNSDGQLFTIEGIAAGLIMLIAVYIVVNTTSVYTPGDTHINDMQLEVIGSDALKMMNIPETGSVGKSPLVRMVETNDGAAFFTSFNHILNNRTETRANTIQFMANVSYEDPMVSGMVNSTPLNMTRPLYGGEHAVHISQWIVVYKGSGSSILPGASQGNHSALVEVLLWRD